MGNGVGDREADPERGLIFSGFCVLFPDECGKLFFPGGGLAVVLHPVKAVRKNPLFFLDGAGPVGLFQGALCHFYPAAAVQLRRRRNTIGFVEHRRVLLSQVAFVT